MIKKPTYEDLPQRIMQSEREDVVMVLNPLGTAPSITQMPLSTRLDTLDGKTIYLVDVRFNDGDILLQQMKKWFDEYMPTVNTLFVQKAGVYTYSDTDLWDEIKEKADAVIMAIGH